MYFLIDSFFAVQRYEISHKSSLFGGAFHVSFALPVLLEFAGNCRTAFMYETALQFYEGLS